MPLLRIRWSAEGDAECRAEYPDFYQICADLDGDGYPGYPDSP